MSRTYMIVDDSPVIRMTMEKMLSKHGIPEDAVHAVDDGERAIELFQELQADVVFTDIDMPGMDGEQAAKLMLNQNPEVKIVIVSGLARDDPRVRRLVSMGAFEVLEKPVHSGDVSALLNLLESEEGQTGRIR